MVHSEAKTIIGNVIDATVVTPVRNTLTAAQEAGQILSAVRRGVGRRLGNHLTEQVLLRGGPVVEAVASRAAEVTHDFQVTRRRRG